MDDDDDLRRESAVVAAGWLCFVVGTALGTLVLWGVARPLAGQGSIGIPAAVVVGIVAAGSFAVGSVRHRRDDTAGMPVWQAIVVRVSDAAVALAVAGVSGLAVLCAGEVLAVGLDGLEVSPLGGGLLAGVASAAAGGFAYGLGMRLRTRELVTLLFAFLIAGTLFSMLTAADPRWWERNFSQLGAGGATAWAFNGTLVVGGLLLATVGSYVGRDLHRILGDEALDRIGRVVAIFALAGAALAAVGLMPLHRAPLAHNVAAFLLLALLAVLAVDTTAVVPGPPRVLMLTTIGVGVGLVVAVLLWRPLAVYSAAALEAVAVGLVFVWLTTLMRTLAALAPDQPRPSARLRLRARTVGGYSAT
ncbi:DUF998 domain-containing protein [Microbacterium oryzae]|uniref:DUF998 domain-containing protein n=1 Tax=Microbacterium oryzae TaxID=743009 RepID=UPI0025B0B316|nr:DUF998 domain-containing protein [Microbacterium oryzae]MDN3311430.1 DUF998 domain-containing protein [Microbacterium oryzae]